MYEDAIDIYGVLEEKIVPESFWISEEIRSYEGLQLRPSSIRIEASTLCQLNCPKCSMRRDEYASLGAGYLRFHDFKKLIDDNTYIKDIELSNYGEVFLNPELKYIIQYAYENDINLYMQNGTNFNDVDNETIDIMAKTGAVKCISISIDGASQEIYALYRRNGRYSKVIENIKRVNAAKRKYGNQYPILSWQYILFKHNENDVDAAKATAEELGINIHFKLDWSGEFKPQNRERLEQLTGLRYFNRHEYQKAIGKSYLMDEICKQMIFSPQINYDGKLLGCCRVNKGYWVQNVFEYGLSAALNSEIYKRGILVLLDKRTNVDAETPCANCMYMSEGFQIMV